MINLYQKAIIEEHTVFDFFLNLHQRFENATIAAHAYCVDPTKCESFNLLKAFEVDRNELA